MGTCPGQREPPTAGPGKELGCRKLGGGGGRLAGGEGPARVFGKEGRGWRWRQGANVGLAKSGAWSGR